MWSASKTGTAAPEMAAEAEVAGDGNAGGGP